MAVNVTRIAHVADLDVEILVQCAPESRCSFGLEFIMQLFRSVGRALTANSHLVMRSNFIQSSLILLTIVNPAVLLADRGKVCFDVLIHVGLVAAQGVLKLVETAANCFFHFTPKRILSQVTLQFWRAEGPGRRLEHVLCLEFSFFFVQLDPHLLHDSFCARVRHR